MSSGFLLKIEFLIENSDFFVFFTPKGVIFCFSDIKKNSGNKKLTLPCRLWQGREICRYAG